MATTHPPFNASDGKPVSVTRFPRDGPPPITVKNLTMAYGTFVVMKDINFTVNHGDIFIIMGASGSGKSTLLRHMLGLLEPARGEVWYGDFNFTKAEPLQREEMLRHFGVLYQSGALWSSMTLAENVGLPLGEFTDLSPAEIREVAALKLALVGLKGFEDYYPSQISGGMQKRAGLARAIALDPEIVFFDEPSSGLDPAETEHFGEILGRAVAERGLARLAHLDRLVLELRLVDDLHSGSLAQRTQPPAVPYLTLQPLAAMALCHEFFLTSKR